MPTTHHRAGAAMRWRAIQLAGVQGVYFLRLLLLAQLLAPDAFGLVAIAMIAIGVIARVTDLGMIPALVQRGSASKAEFDAAWSVGLLRALLIALTLTAFAQPVATLFGVPEAAPMIGALAWRPVIEAAASIGIVRLTRELQFRRLAMIALPAALVDFVVAITTAPSLGVWALVAGSLAGSSASLLLSYALAPHAPRFSLRFDAIRPLIHFGRWVLAAGIVGLVGSTLTHLAISRTEGAAALGLYFLAWRVAFLPAEAVSTVVSAVAFPVFARLRDDVSETARTFRRFLTGMAVTLLPACALVLALAPALEAALGGRWQGTAPLIRILSIAAIVGILSDLVGPLFMGRGRADRAFWLEAMQSAVLLAVLYPLVVALGARGAALAWLVGNVATLVMTVAWLKSMIPGGLAFRPQPLFAAFGAAAAAAAAALVCTSYLEPSAGLVAGGVIGLLVAALVLFALERSMGLGLLELARWVRGVGHHDQAT